MNFRYLAPGIIVIVAAASLLLLGPTAVRKFSHAQAEVQIVQASNYLQSTTILEEFNMATRQIARLVEPSVVHVSTTGVVSGRRGARDFSSSGSGWIWDELGHVVTNAHVVDGSRRIEVQLHDGRIRQAELIGIDLRTDIAVVRIDDGDLHPAHRGSSATVSQGDLVFAFGSPFDFRFSMSSGIVSGLGRSAGLADIDYENFIQVDAAINPGNSGGPLTDIHGDVIGMNTAIATGRGRSLGQGQFAGIGLAIPMSMIENVVTQLIDGGEVQKGFLGVSLQEIGQIHPTYLRYPRMRTIDEMYTGEGVLVTTVTPGSPAESIGIQTGDIITHCDGTRITQYDQIPAMVSSKRPGQTITLDIHRLDESGEEFEKVNLEVALARLEPGVNAEQIVRSLRMAGFNDLQTATPELARIESVEFHRGVIILDVEPALEEALPVGSIIVTAVDQPIGTLDDLYTRLKRYRDQAIRYNLESSVPLMAILPDGSTHTYQLRLR